MIVNWSKPKAGVKVIPIQDDKGAILGHHTLVPGNNFVKDDVWDMLKKNVANDPEKEFINTVTVNVPAKAKPAKLAPAGQSSDDKDKNQHGVYPFKTIIASMKTMGVIEDVRRAYSNETDTPMDKVKNVPKDWLSNFLNKNEDIAKGVTAQIEGVNEDDVVAVSISLKNMKAQQALDIVKDTFNLETLDAWRKVESRDEIRAEIMNQIDRVNKPPRPGDGS